MTDIIRKLATISDVSSLADLRQIDVIMTTINEDRAGEVVVTSGIRYQGWLKAGGAVLFNHNSDFPVAKAISVTPSPTSLRARFQFPPEGTSQASNEIYNLVKAGILSACSIGFRMLKSEPMDPNGSRWGPQRYLESELLECSVVSVPANSEALITGKGLKSGRRISADTRAQLQGAHDLAEQCRGAIADIMDAPGEPDDDEKRAKAKRIRVAEALALGAPPLSMGEITHRSQQKGRSEMNRIGRMTKAERIAEAREIVEGKYRFKSADPAIRSLMAHAEGFNVILSEGRARSIISEAKMMGNNPRLRFEQLYDRGVIR